MGVGKAEADHHAEEWERADRRSFRIALAIALLPIPVALLIAWALGDLPWRPRADRPIGEIAPTSEGMHGNEPR